MTGLDPPSDLFGVPLVMSVDECTALVGDLENCAGTAGIDIRTEAGLARAVDLAESLLNPVARGETVRAAVGGIRPLQDGLISPFSGAPLTVDLGQGRLALSFEGIAVHLLLAPAVAENQELVTVPPMRALAASHFAYTRFRGLAIRKLSSVVEYLRGEGPVLAPPPAAMLLLLLVNRHDDPSRLLPRSDKVLISEFDHAYFPALFAFSNSLKPDAYKSVDAREWSIKGGWLISEINRRIGPSFVVTSAGRYIREVDRDHVVEFLGRDLARRPESSSLVISDALDAFMTAFREQTYPALVRMGEAHEKSSLTRSVITRIQREAEASAPGAS